MGKTAGTILTALFGLGFLLLLWFAFSDRTPTEKDRVVPQTKQQPSLPENDSDLGLLSTIDELQWRLEQAEAEISRLKKEKQNSVPNETEDKEWTKKKNTKTKKTFTMKDLARKELGLPQEAEDRLASLLAIWEEEDKLTPANQAVWRTREAQLLGMLSEEERTQMHERLVQRAEETWQWVAPKVGRMTGVPSSNWGRMREAMGTLEIPPNAILARAHGLHWNGLLERAAPFMEPHMTTEQSHQLQGMIQNQGGK